MNLLVVGDSVPNGARTEATGWPRRLPGLVDGVESVTVRGSMARTLASFADEMDDDSFAGTFDAVLVHAGHNDAQLSGGEPRVPEGRFRAAAGRLNERLAARVDRHAFVGLVPLLPLDRPGSVPFDDGQPGRSLAYDDALAATVGAHVPVARPVADWYDRTADGVHPNGAGHAHLAERVAGWLRNER